jgi:hypothetical protein
MCIQWRLAPVASLAGPTHGRRRTRLIIEIRSGHRALFEGITDVRELMAAAYTPELATILGRCMHDILLGLEAGLEGQPIINTGF